MEWLQPWEAIADLDWPEATKADRIDKLVAQLPREVGPQHVLRGQAVTPIAMRFDTDDTLFRLADGRIAEVHLTWRASEEPDPRWPSTHLFSSLEVWAKERLTPQHEEWSLVGP